MEALFDVFDMCIEEKSPTIFYCNCSKERVEKAVICVGQGPWEIPDSTRQLQSILQSKGISVWVDYWGYDCAHDWDWWYKQVTYFVPHLL